MSSEPYDPYIPNGQQGGAPKDDRTRKIQEVGLFSFSAFFCAHASMVNRMRHAR